MPWKEEAESKGLDSTNDSEYGSYGKVEVPATVQGRWSEGTGIRKGT